MNGSVFDQAVRAHAPVVLGRLIRSYGDFAACEDAMQEALVAALDQWPRDGIPAHPRGWLWTVARRRLIEQIRRDTARRAREERVATEPLDETATTSARDDSLDLFLLCCHPALPRPAQVVLTLRAVGGLTTAEIARAHLVTEATMAQRISRAKRTITTHGGAFPELPADEVTERLDAVAMVLYLIFTEGHVATTGDTVGRLDLSREAIRLTRLLHAARDDGEIAGLLALMLLTDARRPARTTPSGDLVTLAEQDRSLWDSRMIREGVALVRTALATGRPGPYQLQAAIAAVHAEAADVDATDWVQILALYDLLATVAPGPMVAVNRAVAVGEVHGPAAGLGAIAALLEDRPDLAGHHRVLAVRGHLHAAAGHTASAHTDLIAASRLTLSLPEQRYLARRAVEVRSI